ncbi:MAG TPA: M20/M25/M40 family metallo-hydrolase [Candidatus Binataceae bacterium]|nr:M20/M25/M40 family metallo-hydrolase [Candidatus Binataceae bacterium]
MPHRARLVLCALILLSGVQLSWAASSNASQPAPPAPSHPLVRKAPPPRPIDYDKITQEAADLLSKYVQIDTTNPPGNESAAAHFLKEKFLADGIAANTWEPAPGRGIVAARLHGIGRHNKAILLLSHMDVVPADPKQWKVPPFSGRIDNGVIWGRGTRDDKGPGVINLMAMLALKRSGILLDRDVLFVATGDEEEGGRMGAGWFVDHQQPVYSDVGYVLNEGGGIAVEPNGKKLYAVSVVEKIPLWLRITATGPAGHAAAPPAETAVTELVHALQRLIEFHAPIRVLTPVANFYHELAVLGARPPAFLDLDKALQDPGFAKQFDSVPFQNAAVRDTVAPTVLDASNKTNVISPVAYAELDCRLLPGSDPAAFKAELIKIIDDKNIKVDELLNFPSASSPQKTELMSAIETLARRDDGEAPVVATLLGGFTDSHYFRLKKITAYGFEPIESMVGQDSGVHGVNEHIEVKQLGDAIHRMVDLLTILGGR